jgi:hypothetical protein
MTESNVTTLDKVRTERAVSRNEPCLETVISALEQALTELKNGDSYANKCLIVLLNDEGPLATQFPEVYLGGVTPIEALGLLSLAEDDVKEITSGFADLDV